MNECLLVFLASFGILMISTCDVVWSARLSYLSVLFTFLSSSLGVVNLVVIIPRMAKVPSFFDAALWSGVAGATLGACIGVMVSKWWLGRLPPKQEDGGGQGAKG